MPQFSKQSLKMLESVHPDLRKIYESIIKWFDIKILYGERTKKDQDRLFAEGKSKLKYPNSKHNSNPSKAVDACPYPVDWRDTAYLQKQIQRYKNAKTKKEVDDAYNEIIETVQNIQKWFLFIGATLGAGNALGVNVRSGADWNQNEDMSDNKFNDWPHLEIVD